MRVSSLLLACGDKDDDDTAAGGGDDSSLDEGSGGGDDGGDDSSTGDEGGGDDGSTGDDGGTDGGDDGSTGDDGGDDGGTTDGGDDGTEVHPMAGEYTRWAGAAIYVPALSLTEFCEGEGTLVVDDEGLITLTIDCYGFSVLSSPFAMTGEGAMFDDTGASGTLSASGVFTDEAWNATFDASTDPVTIELQSAFAGTYAGYAYEAQVLVGNAPD